VICGSDCGLSLWVPYKLKSFALYGGDDGARTRDLCRDSAGLIGFTMHYRLVRNAEIITGRVRSVFLWVGLWVGIIPIFQA
jgi:hypothetical protein